MYLRNDVLSEGCSMVVRTVTISYHFYLGYLFRISSNQTVSSVDVLCERNQTVLTEILLQV